MDRRHPTSLMLLLPLMMAACGSGTADMQTATSSQPPMTITGPVAPESTVVVPTTTTTSVPDSIAGPTTTDAPPDDASDRPVVASIYGALGWWDGSDWVRASGSDDGDLTGEYQLVTLAGSSRESAATEDSFCDEEMGGPALGPALDFDGAAVAIRAAWNVTPAAIEQLDSRSSTYLDIVADHLVGTPVEGAAPAITQIVRADLDGNGEDEVILLAESVADGEVIGEPGDYSVLLFRTVVDDQAAMTGLESTFVADETDSPYVLNQDLAAIADLNGDGVAEVVVTNQSYEGAGITVYALVDDATTLEPVLGMICGV